MALVNAVEPLTLKPAPQVLGAETRRFELPDIDRHGAWLFPRFLKTYPHLNERSAIGFIKSALYSPEFLFLYQEKGVALAQAVSAGSLDGEPVVWERFCWVSDPDNKDQAEAASFFYPEFAKWAKRKGMTTIVVDQNTDVSPDLLKARLGRLTVTEQKSVRLS